MTTLSAADLAACIDHTILKAETTPEEVDAVVDEAIQLGCASVCVNGVYAPRVRERLDGARREKNHNVKLCVVAGFPLGATLPMTRAIESTQLAKLGAEEVDVVAYLPRLLRRDADGLRDDLLETVRAVRAVAGDIVVKVIIESALLRERAGSDDEFEAIIRTACEAAAQAGCDFVKTSTGFHPAGGASLEAVRLMKKHAGPLKVKASGGVRTYEDALAMVEAGADRLGCSSTAAIIAGAPAEAGRA
jgi:deoxyribose-phosphate aldolase